jgi:hypothetical protein
VKNNKRSISSFLHIELYSVNAEFQRRFERFQRIVGKVAGEAAVGNIYDFFHVIYPVWHLYQGIFAWPPSAYSL